MLLGHKEVTDLGEEGGEPLTMKYPCWLTNAKSATSLDGKEATPPLERAKLRHKATIIIS